MKKIRLTNVMIIAVMMCITLTISSCSDSKSSNDEDKMNIEIKIEEVRELTEAFHNFEQAMAAGWSVDLSGCVEHPEEGGMGHHFARPDYLDGRVNHLQPQILLYEPMADGSYAFVGVEYVVPFTILSPDAEAPELFGHHFHQNHHQGIWALHVWTEKENPRGMFFDWNPSVSCAHQDAPVARMLDEIRDATQAYHDVDVAMADGWNAVLSPCVEHPTEGGMGYHYGRMEFFDGRRNHAQPQVLLYEPKEDGSLEFIGVEFIIPFDIHPAQAPPPVVMNEHYHPNEAQNFWALHVWTEKDNPNGTFADWNPNVSCDFAND